MWTGMCLYSRKMVRWNGFPNRLLELVSCFQWYRGTRAVVKWIHFKAARAVHTVTSGDLGGLTIWMKLEDHSHHGNVDNCPPVCENLVHLSTRTERTHDLESSVNWHNRHGSSDPLYVHLLSFPKSLEWTCESIVRRTSPFVKLFRVGDIVSLPTLQWSLWI